MGMNLGVKTTTYGAHEDQTWLGSEHGTQNCESITLDAALCTAVFATGVVPSGTPLTKRGTGRYSPSLDNGAGADDVIEGHLFTTVDLTAGGKSAAVDTPAALFVHGKVRVAKIPTYTGRTDVNLAANRAPHIRYI